MYDNYLKFIVFLNNKLDKYFEAQSPYIFCKRGCSKCCQSGEYPFSKIELDFLMIGFYQLSGEIQNQIAEKISKIKEEKTKSKNSPFMYECPFLINNECSVYKYRGIICRTFGLISSLDNEIPKIPFCAYEGLNYSNVLDPETNIISEEKFKLLNTDKMPLVYNVSYKFLTSEVVEKDFDFKFGEKRPLIDWF
ncbi:YkgJ family cysteine cluster protein [bacterium]|nr:YkgJ family cysteine cluster protein [bacterium]